MGNTRKLLYINGTLRSFICDEKDTLADALRHLGLTGTKVGCGTGVCGACTVILNGDVVRACCRKIAKIEDQSTVETIEGLGTAENLHPLQQAWITYGGVQCGFCTPGFIMSAKGLLDKNPSPTRSEVREWFRAHQNACRCTGYKPLVDCVMAAAAVMRGEKTMEDITYKQDPNKVFNTRAPKPTALGKVLGTTLFGDDIGETTPGMVYMAPVCSTEIAHAIIKGIDYSEAEKMPGVIKVLTAKDVKGTNRIKYAIGTALAKGDKWERPLINDEKIFHRGDVVALVAAESTRIAREAAKLVKMDLEPLPEYTDVLDAIKPGAVEIQPGTKNAFLKKPLFKGEDTKPIIDAAPYSAEFSFYAQRQPHLPIEPDTAQAYMEDDGTVTIMYKSHAIYQQKNYLSEAIGMPKDKMRVIMNPSGGAFGYSFSPKTPGLAAIGAIALNRPVSITYTYAEHQMITGKRPAAYTNARLACDENGMIVAGELDMMTETGAYPELANTQATNPTKYFLVPYGVPNARAIGRTAYSNAQHAVAYRCPACPAIYSNVEQLVDILAKKAGIDPLEFRLKNVWKPGGETGVNGEPPTAYVIEGIVERMRPKYKELKKHAAAANSKEGLRYGVGVALGSFSVAANGDIAQVALELNPDGTVTHLNTWEDMGQGADIGSLAIAHEALKPLGLRVDQIRILMNDTAKCPDTGRAAASRSNFMVSHAVHDAAEKLMNAMRREDGTYRTYDEMVAEGIPTKYIGTIRTPKNPLVSENTGLGKPSPDQSYAGFVAEVTVDEATGKTSVIEMHAFTDVGTVTNYLSYEGQGYSGMMHSMGYALSEDYSLPKHDNMKAAGFVFINDVPDAEHFTCTDNSTVRDYSPYGGTGISEGFQSSGQAAILNAIADAVDIRVSGQPATAEKVKAAIDAKKNGTYKPTEPFFLGSDFYQDLEYMKENPAGIYEGEEDLH